ncbi:hypothetical protein [Lacinutrix salivirga]
MNKAQQLLKWIFGIGVISYAIITAIYIFNIPPGRGDELLFINDLELIKTKGWSFAIIKNISIPYLLLAYPLSLLFKNYIALRLTSLFLTIGLAYYLYRRNKASLSFYSYFLFYLSTTIFFFYGTNDTLFNVGLIVFFNEVFQLYTNKSFNSNLAFSALLIAFFTRALTLVYLPVIVIALFIIYKHRAYFQFKWKIAGLTLVVLLGFNMPSLQANKHLSYDLKAPPKALNVTWGQRQYLAQLLVNEGAIENGGHPSWKETQAYIDKNGTDALPVGILNGMLFNVKLTAKEFFKDLLYSSKATFRQIGFIFVLLLVLPLRQFLKHRRVEYELFVPAALVIMLCIFSLIIISYVELRWFAPVFVMTLIWYHNKEKNNLIPQQLFLVNYIVFIALVGYGSFRMFDKIV